MERNRKIKNAFNFMLIALCMILFVLVLRPAFQPDKTSTRSFEEVSTQTLEGIDTSTYPTKDAQSMRRYLQIDPAQFESIAFYRLDDAMSADELLIARFSTPEAAQAFEQAVRTRIDTQANIYAGYAPEQEQIMKDAKVVIEGNYAIYVSGTQAAQIAGQFEQAL